MGNKYDMTDNLHNCLQTLYLFKTTNKCGHGKGTSLSEEGGDAPCQGTLLAEQHTFDALGF